MNTSPSPFAETPATRNFLGADVKITGTLKFAEELIFDGELNGKIVSPGSLTVGKRARITGEVNTRMVTVNGYVEGNIVVTERCQLKADSSVNGDVKAARILVEDGATFIGNSQVGVSQRQEDAKLPRSASAPAPAARR